MQREDFGIVNVISEFKRQPKTKYLYASGGAKLRQVTYNNGTPTEQLDYSGNFVYENSSLKFIITSEGRLLPTANGFEREYYLSDHLGNTRVVFKKSGDSALIIQENHYYAYGMEIADQSFSSTPVPNTFLYNGKEYDTNSGYYQYGFRQYDAQIGRWWVIDPAAISYMSFSPYHFAGCNPVGNLETNGATYQGNNQYSDNSFWGFMTNHYPEGFRYRGGWVVGGNYYQPNLSGGYTEYPIGGIGGFNWGKSAGPGYSELMHSLFVKANALAIKVNWDQLTGFLKYGTIATVSTTGAKMVWVGDSDPFIDGTFDFILGAAKPLAWHVGEVLHMAIKGEFKGLANLLAPTMGLAEQSVLFLEGDSYTKKRIGTNLFLQAVSAAVIGKVAGGSSGAKVPNNKKSFSYVFRAVDNVELESIKANKKFILPDNTLYDKYFAKSFKDANEYGQRLYPEGYTIVIGRINGSISQFWFPYIDIGAYVIPNSFLPNITPIIP